jgi:hypothetical protein
MPVLEARFYPRSKADPSFVVVGRVICEGTRTSIIPADLTARMVRPFDAGGLQSKLQFLVACASADPFRELTLMRSDFWAFVGGGDDANAGGGAP